MLIIKEPFEKDPISYESIPNINTPLLTYPSKKTIMVFYSISYKHDDERLRLDITLFYFHIEYTSSLTLGIMVKLRDFRHTFLDFDRRHDLSKCHFWDTEDIWNYWEFGDIDVFFVIREREDICEIWEFEDIDDICFCNLFEDDWEHRLFRIEHQRQRPTIFEELYAASEPSEKRAIRAGPTLRGEGVRNVKVY